MKKHLFKINRINFFVKKNNDNIYINDILLTEEEFNKILTSILRSYDEIRYMKEKNKNIDTIELSNIDNLMIFKDNDKISISFFKNNFILNMKEFENLISEIYDYLNNTYPINFNYNDIDPIYFSLFLYKELPFITHVKINEVNINSFRMLRFGGNSVPLEETDCYKALVNGKNTKIFHPFPSNHLIDSDYQRIKNAYNSIKMNGYPFQGKYIILYNDEFYIRDGQHRACALKFLYGNISVPVLRIYLKDNKMVD